MREEQSTRILQNSSTLLAEVTTAAIMFAGALLAGNDDLAGDWFLCGSDIQGNHTWDGNVVLSSDGSVTGGSMNGSDGPTYGLVGGSLSIDDPGRVTGTIQNSDGNTTRFMMHMDPARGLVAGEGNAVGGNEDGVFILVRKPQPKPAAIVCVAIDQPGQRVELSIADLYPGSYYTIQRSLTLLPDDWLDLQTFEALDVSMTLFEGLGPDGSHAFWRINNE